VVYGEVTSTVAVGDMLEAGACLGHVARVLRNDKGRPTCMLHIELHRHGARTAPPWDTLDARPETLLDPTPLLLDCTAPTAV
jgi:hypothetical protein